MKLLKKINNNFYLLKNNLYKEDKIFTHLEIDEKKELFLLAASFKEYANIVEIGSYLGSSSCFLSAGLKNGFVYCIDTWQNDAMSESNKDTYTQFCDNTSKYSNKIRKIRGWSYNVVDQILEKTSNIDLLFIDGDHSYEGVKKDWDVYSPFLRSGSIIVMHDSGWADGVKKVIEENIKSKVSQEKTMPNMWWGIIK